MKAMMNKVCAFTGHRPNKLPWRYDEKDARCLALKEVLAEQIAALAGAGFTHFLSGMAEATDTWSALAVLSLREKNPAIKLHCNHHADRCAVCTNRDERVQTSGRLSCKIELRRKYTTTHGERSRRLLSEFKPVY